MKHPKQSPKTTLCDNRYTVLGIDTAAISGYALRTRGRLIWSGEVDTKRSDQVAHVVLDARDHAARSNTQLAVIFERAYGGPRHTVEGLAMARERWLVVLRDHRIAGSHTVMPNRWRRDLFGPRKGMRRAGWRALEMATALSEVARGVVLGSDEAAAICISRWGSTWILSAS
jgi:hypothetical protein